MGLEHLVRATCMRCGSHYGTQGLYTCPGCGIEGILDLEYDYDAVARTLTREALRSRAGNLWRYLELLPVDSTRELPHPHVGMTPIYDVPRLAAAVGVRALKVKDDGRNPTASFKDRASAVGVLKAREQGSDVIACASAGNAAASLAGFSAAVGLKSVIFVPERTPEPKVAQVLIFGGTVLRVKGSYDDAYAVCQDACARFGWYNRNCAVNPYLIEGKKTVGLEMAEQLGEELPDWVVFSVGDGCTLAGAWKGLWEMHRLGFLSRLPRMLGVQAEGSAPLVDEYVRREGSIRPVEARTLADSIAVGQPRNWRKALRAISESQGAMLAVDDASILEAMRRTARLAAVFAEPAGACAVAGLTRAVEQGIVGHDESALVVVTGNGLKDIRSAADASARPIDLPADMAGLEQVLRARQLI
ncbi:threonine synthase [Corallococcus exiguus]|uniref:threonine synthase n=1 Tax=Corallococcus exiguus TaxID=83462 RepID=UPI001A8D359F|nr:threonine synthase [Corallococcus exiguus]MBN8471061.1 threonine synthase [Corallococcus exiguus]